MSTKRDIAVRLLEDYAVYMKDSPKLKYQIRLRGKFLASECTNDLANQVAATFTRKELEKM